LKLTHELKFINIPRSAPLSSAARDGWRDRFVLSGSRRKPRPLKRDSCTLPKPNTLVSLLRASERRGCRVVNNLPNESESSVVWW